MYYKRVYVIVIVFRALISPSCSKDETETGPKQYLDNEYNGFLKLHYTNQFPAIDKTTQVSVDINKFGIMTFGTATLSYDADDNNGQTRIRRNGTLILNPKGNYLFENGKDLFEVNENTTIQETMTIWYGDGVNWTQFSSENINGLWNGGLVFDLQDAVWNGSHVSLITGYGSGDWSLHLVVKP